MISSQRKIWLIILGFGTLFIGLIFVSILPLLNNIKMSSQALVLQKATLTLLQKQVNEIEGFQKSYLVIQRDLAKFEEGFVDIEVPIKFIEFLEAEAQGAGLEIEISPLSSVINREGPWWSTTFQISLRGNSGNCLRFLERLEQSHWLLELLQINIARISERSSRLREERVFEAGDVDFSVQLKAFSTSSVYKGGS